MISNAAAGRNARGARVALDAGSVAANPAEAINRKNGRSIAAACDRHPEAA